MIEGVVVKECVVHSDDRGLLVEIVLEDGFDTLVRTRADTDSAAAGGFEARLAVACAEPHDAQTRAEALLGMRP